jgi:hypothetical protein
MMKPEQKNDFLEEKIRQLDKLSKRKPQTAD